MRPPELRAYHTYKKGGRRGRAKSVPTQGSRLDRPAPRYPPGPCFVTVTVPHWFLCQATRHQLDFYCTESASRLPGTPVAKPVENAPYRRRSAVSDRSGLVGFAKLGEDPNHGIDSSSFLSLSGDSDLHGSCFQQRVRWLSDVLGKQSANLVGSSPRSRPAASDTAAVLNEIACISHLASLPMLPVAKGSSVDEK